MSRNVLAVVLKEIHITGEFVVPAEAVVQVDPENGVALYEGLHFDIYPDEYSVIN